MLVMVVFFIAFRWIHLSTPLIRMFLLVLIFTTSCGLALERALLSAVEELDIVSLLAAGRNRGKCCDVALDGTGILIEVPITFVTQILLERRTIILKLHGQVGRSGEVREW